MTQPTPEAPMPMPIDSPDVFSAPTDAPQTPGLPFTVPPLTETYGQPVTPPDLGGVVRSIFDEMLQAVAMGPYAPEAPVGTLGPELNSVRVAAPPAAPPGPSLNGMRSVVDPSTGNRSVVPGSATNMDDRVYMGHDITTSPGVEMGGVPNETGTTTHKSTTVSAAYNLPYVWYSQNPDKINELEQKMRKAGMTIGSGGDAFGDMMNAWKMLVDRASAVYVMSGGTSLTTPYDVLSTMKKENEANGVLDENGNVVTTAKARTVNNLSEGQAFNLARSIVQQTLGRDPTDQEVRDFLSKANNEASQNPSVSTRTTTTDSMTGRQSTSRTVNNPGFTQDDAAQQLYQQMVQSPEYAHVQGATTYMNALIGALGESAGG